MNENFQKALKGEEQKVPPIWFMRQAGRYQKTYRQLRECYSFEELCKVPELSAQVGLNAVKEFDFDLCILFSDILFPLQTLGFGLDYSPAPKLGWHLDSQEDFKKLVSVEEAFEGMKFQADCLKATREVLPKDKSLIGFVGGLWTLFGYATEGSHKGHMLQSKKRLSLFKPFCDEFLYPLIKKNIQMQLDNCAEVVMFFDTAMGELSADLYQELVFPYLKKLSQDFPGKLGYYAKGGNLNYYSQEFYDLDLAGVGWDHRWSLTEVLKNKRHKGFTQGNFDQALLHQNTEDFKQSLSYYLKQFKNKDLDLRGYVSGLGHGVLPKTPEDHVKYMVNEIREFFATRNSEF